MSGDGVLEHQEVVSSTYKGDTPCSDRSSHAWGGGGGVKAPGEKTVDIVPFLGFARGSVGEECPVSGETHSRNGGGGERVEEGGSPVAHGSGREEKLQVRSVFFSYRNLPTATVEELPPPGGFVLVAIDSANGSGGGGGGKGGMPYVG